MYRLYNTLQTLSIQKKCFDAERYHHALAHKKKRGVWHREEIEFLYDADHIHTLMASFMIDTNKLQYG
ncbi:uncharacterized protein Dvar_22170 [Desulfosarcina variabilis str. Montpellier]